MQLYSLMLFADFGSGDREGIGDIEGVFGAEEGNFEEGVSGVNRLL